MMRASRILALFAALGSVSGPAFAQCAMCAQNAAAQGARASRTMSLGVAILLFPLAGIVGGICRAAYRNRD